jgi:hypothetical protein
VPFGEPTPEASITSGQGHKKSGTLGHEDIKITGKHYNPGSRAVKNTGSSSPGDLRMRAAFLLSLLTRSLLHPFVLPFLGETLWGWNELIKLAGGKPEARRKFA